MSEGREGEALSINQSTTHHFTSHGCVSLLLPTTTSTTIDRIYSGLVSMSPLLFVHDCGRREKEKARGIGGKLSPGNYQLLLCDQSFIVNPYIHCEWYYWSRDDSCWMPLMRLNLPFCPSSSSSSQLRADTPLHYPTDRIKR